MRNVDLDGLRVMLGQPSVVAEQQGHCWFPGLTRFPNGELFAGFSIAADEHQWMVVTAYGGAVGRSLDGGKTWEGHYPSYHYNGGKTILPDGSLLLMMCASAYNPPGQAKTLTGPYVLYRDGGRQCHIEAEGMRIEGLPDVVQPRDNGTPTFDAASEILMLENDRLLVLAFTRFVGDSLSSLLAFTSNDLGRTWRYTSTVAKPGDESALVRLDGGDLLCVFRVGGCQPFRKAYSRDGGESWSSVEEMDEPFSVKPALVRLQSGVLALTGGRIGIFLWLCTDGRGDRWRQVDIVEHHNKVMSMPHHIRLHPENAGEGQTTSYTGMVEIAPNEVLVLYDRTPIGWQPVPKDSPERSRVYALRIGVAKR